MKILCVIDSLGSGGAQRQLVELAKGFKEKGHIVSFLTYHDINFFKPELDKHQIPLQTVIEPSYIKRLFKLRKAIKSHQPDAVLSFLEAASFTATLSGFPYRKWKLVVGERSANPAILTSPILRFYRIFHLFADFVVANSHKNLDLVKKANPLIKTKKAKVIYNSVEIPSKLPKQLLNLNKTKIVVAASYRAVKNLDGLIQAVHLLPKEYQSILKIEWYGNISMDNIYYQENAKIIKELGLEKIFTLNDKTNQVKQKYATADFIGLFSHYEGFPNTICEAMALGKPVIVTKVSDVPLFVKENENGFLCESSNVVKIKKALIKAIDSSVEQGKLMGANNYKLAKQEFNKEVIVEQYLNLLQGE
jgi:glycosyltransferase involved in cell wall biosynthesis